MLRLRLISSVAFGTVALCSAVPAVAQQGTGERIDAAGKKLDDDIRACRKIDPSDYQALVDETNRNVTAAKSAAKAGLPVDQAKLTADMNKASALLKRAQDAAAKPCPPPQQQPQPQPPMQAPVRPNALPGTGGQPVGGGWGPPSDWDEFQDDAWDLIDDLEEDIFYCDIKDIHKLIPELEDAARKARQMAKTAKAAGKFSKIKPEDAEKLARQLELAAGWAKGFKGCPKFQPMRPEFTDTPPPKSATPETPKQPTEKPIPPKISIVEDLRDPPTPFEVNAIKSRIDELGKITRDYPNMLEGCHPDIWDKHIGHLEDLANRARQIADDVKRGYSNGVSAKDAEQTARDAEKAVEDARRGKAANQEQWSVPECPKTTPLPKRDKSQGMRIPDQPSPYQNVGAAQTGSYASGPSPRSPVSTEAKNARQEFESIYYGLGGLGYAFASSDGCTQQQLQGYIAGLEQFARRARSLAETAREGGEFSTVNAADIQQLAQSIQRHIEEAKQFEAVDCPAGVRFKMSPWSGKIVAIHNQERAAVGARPLRWDPILAAHADSYAQDLARTGQLTHAPRPGRGIERENLGQGRIGWSPEQIVRDEWMSERRSFHAGIFPDVCVGGGSTCWHYSQAIWEATTDIGCGYAVGSGFSWLVCRYSPGGNKDKYPVGYYDPWSRGASRLLPPPPPPPPPPP